MYHIISATFLGGLGIISESGPAEVKGVHKDQRHSSSHSTRGNVLAKVYHIRVSLLHHKHGLDLVLEGEVKRLCGKVPDAVGQVASPERQYSCEVLVL